MSMKLPASLQQLIDSFQILPGVGPKSAQRMAFILLEDQQGATQLAQAVQQALTQIKSCNICRNYTQTDTCEICAEPARSEQAAICVVAQPQDVLSIEQTGHFHGRYFVLKGLLSPIELQVVVITHGGGISLVSGDTNLSLALMGGAFLRTS